MANLVVSNGAINTISENTEINISEENEAKRNENVVVKPQVSKEALNTSPSINNVENANILQDKTSTFNNSYVFHNQQPPVDSPMTPVENNVDISVNTKENLNITQNVDDENKNKRLTILVNAPEDNIHDLADKYPTNVTKVVANEENSESFLQGGKKRSKILTIIGSNSEDDIFNNITDKNSTNLIENEENSATSVEEGKTHPTKKGITSAINAVDNGENSTTLTEKEKKLSQLLTIMDSDLDEDLNIAEKDTANVVKAIGDEKNIEEGKKQRRRITIMDSDSDDDLNIAEKGGTNVVKATSGEENIKEKKQRKQLTIIDSDSEDANIDNSDKEDKLTEEYGLIKDKEQKKKRKRLTVITSDDSESENEERTIADQESLHVSPTVEPLTEEIIEKQKVKISGEEKKKSRFMQICDSDSEDENIQTSNNVNINSITDSENILTDNKEHTLRLQTLCDSESSAEEEETSKINQTQVSKAKKSAKLPKDTDLLEKPVTGRDALKQRQQIKSESQKMCRESHVSLPYHRPKQHTLQDFLKRRSLLNNIVPSNTSTSFAIKMSGQELKRTMQQLKEREKKIALFYKSESEEDEESEEHVQNCCQIEVENTQKETEKAIEPVVQEESVVGGTKVSESDQIEEGIMDYLEKEAIQEEVLQVQNEIEDSLFVDKDEEMDIIQNNITEVIGKIDDIVSEEVQQDTEIDNASEEGLDGYTEKDKEEKLQELRIVLQKTLGSLNQSDVKLINDTKNKEPSFEELLSSTILPPVVEPQTKITPEREQENKMEQKLKKLNPLIALKKSFEPLRLSGDPNEVIVLDEGFERSKNVSKLMKRFFIHTAKKQVQKKTEISVLNADGHGRHQETILVTEDVEEPAKKHQIPGLRMKKLREELEAQIKQKRLEEFRKKKAEYKLDNEEGDDSVYEGEKMDCGLGDDVLDNEDEEELTDEDSSEEEEDEEENDVELRDKPRVKSAFVDEEAEESDLEDQENEPVEDAKDDQYEETDDEPEELLVSQTKRPLKRIIQTLDDSDDEKVEENITESQEELSDNNVESSEEVLPSQEQLQSTCGGEFDGEIPAYQPRNGQQTPCKLMTQNKQDISCFLSPTLNLTALQGRKPGDYSTIEESPKIVLSVPAKPSPLKDHPFLKTRLFSQNSQTLDDFYELAALCSGKFPSPKNNVPEGLSTQEQSLLDICSGTFSGLQGLNNEAITTKEIIQDLGEKRGVSQERNKEEILLSSNSKEFDVRNFNYPKFKIASSSDEENISKEDQNKKKKLKKKRRYVIDDISLSDEDEENKDNDFDDLSLEEEEGEECDKLDELGKEEDEERHNINYDSEENEVDYEETAQIAKKKARDFFEAEAELSGSEWGSEDEDEKGLDDFEVEDADGEKINEKKVQQELERMHIRNILDDDQRDVRLLQELLLEDGELHGQGREKKFKWKNTASLTWDEENAPKEEDEDVEDVESEQQWRKMRHEREAFLNEQKKKAEQQCEEEDLSASDSQFLRLGEMALQKSISSSQSSQMNTTVTESIVMMEDIKLPFNLNNKRGSFLARGETTLARLAEITRTTTGGLNNRAKNSRNFVFTAVEKTEKSTTVIENEKKRKADDSVPKIPKKIRITNSGSDANKKTTKVQRKS